MCIPIEFVVVGRPHSVNDKDSSKKQIWKSAVLSSCQNEIKKKKSIMNPAPYADEVTIKVFYFPKTNQYSDVDNGLKYLIDAISEEKGKTSNPPKLLKDDSNVTRIIAERIKMTAGNLVNVPLGAAANIAQAIFFSEQATAVKIEAYISNNGAHW